MATITEDYVSFETSKLLKEKGFDQNCATYYLDGQVWRHYHCEVLPKNKQIYAAPTQAIAMKWLREVYNFHIWVEPSHDKEGLYNAHVKVGWWSNNWAGVGYNTYEKAVEAAIEYCLKILI